MQKCNEREISVHQSTRCSFSNFSNYSKHGGVTHFHTSQTHISNRSFPHIKYTFAVTSMVRRALTNSALHMAF